MSLVRGWVQRNLAGVVALVLLFAMFQAARLPAASGEESRDVAGQFKFSPYAITLPGGHPRQSIREVNQEYSHIRAWISSVGAGIALNDLDGDGLPNDLCMSEPRIDRVVVAPSPGAASDRYQTFVLDPDPLPMDDNMAPMGCVPGDYNEDGRIDLLVYYWGRTPIVFLAKSDAQKLTAETYRPVELMPAPERADGGYGGPRWNSNAVTVADFDGDGHDDIHIGNYFPNSPVLNENLDGGVTMHNSMSRAFNGGDEHIFRWTGGHSGTEPTVSYTEAENVLPDRVSGGWTLAAGATDLDGDLLPELYLGHDFGPDRLLYNRSTPGNIEFSVVTAERDPMEPKSKVLGHDSFKGMGIDFWDANGDGLYDMFVSNITTTFGLQESNYAFVNTADSEADLQRMFRAGVAPYEDRSAPLGLAWSGWGWDVKAGDFNNDGTDEIIQATGFVKGKVNRWAQLQELATTNDLFISAPSAWPNVKQQDDIAGDQSLAFFAKYDEGSYTRLTEELGLDIPIPTRGIAVADTDGDGDLDFAVARQWADSVFYQNDTQSSGEFLGLRLTHATTIGDGGPATKGVLSAPGSPVVGAQVTVTTDDGRTLLGRVDGGSGHSGKRSHEVFIGLGEVDGPVSAHLEWRDRDGNIREQDLELSPGWHALQLDTEAQEVTS